MVKEYTYLIVYQAQLYTGAIAALNTKFTMLVTCCPEDDEFYEDVRSYAFEEAEAKFPNNVSNIVISNIINLTKMKPIMEV